MTPVATIVAAALLSSGGVCAAGPAGAAPDDVEPISLATWFTDGRADAPAADGGADEFGPKPTPKPAFEHDGFRFELLRVESAFEVAMAEPRFPVGGAAIMVEAQVVLPEAGAVVSRHASLALDAVVDGRGRDLLALGEHADWGADRLVMFHRPRDARGGRPRQSVRTQLTGCPEIPDVLRTLRGRARFVVPTVLRSVEVPCAVMDDETEVVPGFFVRISKITRTERTATVHCEYVVRNAPTGFVNGEPPFLLDVTLLDADGALLSRGWSVPPTGRTIRRATGLHSTVRAVAVPGTVAEIAHVRFGVITDTRRVEIPFHFTDVPLHGAVAREPAPAAPAYVAGSFPPAHQVEQGGVRLELLSIRSEHDLRFVTWPGGSPFSGAVVGRMRLRLPPGVWAHRQPVVSELRRSDGSAVPFRTMAYEEGADRFRFFRRVGPRERQQVFLDFTCRHDEAPIRAAAALVGAADLHRATKLERIDIPWRAAAAHEVAPGMTVEVGAPARDGDEYRIALTVVGPYPADPGAAPLPFVLAKTVVDAQGIELPSRPGRSGGGGVADGRVTTPEEIIVTPLAPGAPPTAIRLTVVTRAELMTLPFRFEDLPFQLRVASEPPE